jgi:predicted nucleotidyltransferase
MTNLDKVSPKQIEQFCKKWSVEELSLFGSVIREDFNSESDVDVLISFLPDAKWTLFDHVDMKEDLKSIFSRNVDLVTKKAVERSHNTVRKNSIISSAKQVYFKE